MDTTKMEYTAEDLIAHKLQKAGILVSKPKFDRDGTDLIALLSVKDGASFCRIQCKGRSLAHSDSLPVTIKKEYVEGAFVTFLYVEDKDEKIDHTNLFVFFTDDIREWGLDEEGKYRLSVTRKRVQEEFEKFRFSDNSIERIKEIIREAKPEREIRMLLPSTYLYEPNGASEEIFAGKDGTTTMKDKRFGTEVTRTTSPTGPGNSEYSPQTDTWVTKQ